MRKNKKNAQPLQRPDAKEYFYFQEDTTIVHNSVSNFKHNIIDFLIKFAFIALVMLGAWLMLSVLETTLNAFPVFVIVGLALALAWVVTIELREDWGRRQ